MAPRMVTLLCFFTLGVAVTKGQCVPNNPAGEVYEYALSGTQVLSLDGVGVVGTEVDLALDSTLSSLLELSDVKVVVKPGVNITRSDANSGSVLTGQVTCTIISSSSPRMFSIYIEIKNVNLNNPVFNSASYSAEISEASLLGTEILTVSATDPDGLFPTYSITCDSCKTPSFKVDSSTGLITLNEALSFPPSTYDITVFATTDDNNPYGERIRNSSTVVVVNILDVDNHPPQFQPCASENDCFLIYFSHISTTYTGDLNIIPENIVAVDLDPGIDAAITYAFTDSSIPVNYMDHFYINKNTGVVTVEKAVTSKMVYTLGIGATESTGKESFALLRVDVNVEDDYKPQLNSSSSEGYLQESLIETQTYVTEDENGMIPLKISAYDLDDENASFQYKVTPKDFQITSDGFVAYFPSVFGIYSLAPSSFEITVVNIDVDSESPNRMSNPTTIALIIVPSPTTTTTMKTAYTTKDTTVTPSKTGFGCSVYQFNFPAAQQINDYVRYRSYFSQMAKGATTCMWVNPRSMSSGFVSIASYAISSNSNEYIIGIVNGKVSIYIAGSKTAFPVAVPLNTWTHLCLWYDTTSSQVGVFKNGEDTNSFAYDGGYVRGGGALVLGQEQDSVGGKFDSAQSFHGSIYAFSIWPRKLLSHEMANIAENGNCPVDNSVDMRMDRAEIFGAVSYEITSCPV
ncbi:unnamed protein product [Clavelina lepadiformis]|uniref:Staphylococcus aureus surface protein A n=1 Tax=Clavelina lepadiformis TaxID=159417 RepID=A0ABP0F7G3_CLALP